MSVLQVSNTLHLLAYFIILFVRLTYILRLQVRVATDFSPIILYLLSWLCDYRMFGFVVSNLRNTGTRVRSHEVSYMNKFYVVKLASVSCLLFYEIEFLAPTFVQSNYCRT
ncbi:hypothetical protein AAZV13_07G199600 [Glycine max]